MTGSISVCIITEGHHVVCILSLHQCSLILASALLCGQTESCFNNVTIACVSAALGAPTAEEGRLISDLVKSFGSPSGMPTLLKKRKTSRAMTVLDFARPVETPAERAWFFEWFAKVANAVAGLIGL